MIIRKPTIIIQRSRLSWLIPVICFLCSNSILAVGSTPEIEQEKISLTDFVEFTMAVDTMDYSILTRKELKQELKKLKKTDQVLYYKVKSEYLEPNELVRAVIVVLVSFAVISFGLMLGCAIYS